MRATAAILSLMLAGFLGGCAASAPRYSQAQLNAIESREVEASLDETFSAASNALFDAGYTIAMSDRQGGLLTGTKGKDNTAARIWVSPYIQDTHFTVSVQMRQQAPKLTVTRVKTSVNGEPYVKKEAIDQFWVLMQRQVLMKEPLPIPDEPKAASKQDSEAPH